MWLILLILFVLIFAGGFAIHWIWLLIIVLILWAALGGRL